MISWGLKHQGLIEKKNIAVQIIISAALATTVVVLSAKERETRWRVIMALCLLLLCCCSKAQKSEPWHWSHPWFLQQRSQDRVVNKLLQHPTKNAHVLFLYFFLSFFLFWIYDAYVGLLQLCLVSQELRISINKLGEQEAEKHVLSFFSDSPIRVRKRGTCAGWPWKAKQLAAWLRWCRLVLE